MPTALAVAYRPTAQQAPRQRMALAESLAPLDGVGAVIALRRDEPLFRPTETAEFYFKVLKGASRSCARLSRRRANACSFSAI
jgi:hypothetical protein